MLDACIVIPPEAAHAFSAMNRVKKDLPPARKGKAEPKDCEIYELFLSLCNDLQANEVDMIFASSNIQDYGVKNAGGIAPELAILNAKYVNAWNWLNATLEGRS